MNDEQKLKRVIGILEGGVVEEHDFMSPYYLLDNNENGSFELDGITVEVLGSRISSVTLEDSVFTKDYFIKVGEVYCSVEFTISEIDEWVSDWTRRINFQPLVSEIAIKLAD